VVHPVVVEGLPLIEDPLEDLLDDVRIDPGLRLRLLLLPDLRLEGVMIGNRRKKDLLIRNLPPEKEVGLVLPNVVKDLHLRLQLNKFVEFFYGVIIYESFWPKRNLKATLLTRRAYFFLSCDITYIWAFFV
jgi:hypothetical protein